MIRIRLHIVAIVLFIVGFYACMPEEECRTDMHVAMNVALQADSIGINGQQYPYTSWDSISVQPIGHDSIPYDNAKNVSILALSLRPNANTTTYALLYHDVWDTLHIEHQNNEVFINMACGCVIYATIDTVYHTQHWIDSVAIVNSHIERGKEKNLILYVHEQ